MMDRFLAKVNKLGPMHPVLKTRCWQWLASNAKNGYSQFWACGKNHKASRVAYQLFVGAIPQGLMVLHDCDNITCVNPEHLRLGTHTDNMTDRNNKGRQAFGLRNGNYTKPHRRPKGPTSGPTKHPESYRGESNGRAKLTVEEVLKIRELKSSGWRISDIAKKYGVNWRTIYLIVNRINWKHVA